MTRSLILTLHNRSQQPLSLSPLTASSSPWRSPPPPTLGPGGTARLSTESDGDLYAQVWYGDTETPPHGVSVAIAAGGLSGVHCQMAEVTAQRQDRDSYTIEVALADSVAELDDEPDDAPPPEAAPAAETDEADAVGRLAEQAETEARFAESEAAAQSAAAAAAAEALADQDGAETDTARDTPPTAKSKS